MINSCAAIVIAAKHGELSKIKDVSGIAHTVGALRCKFDFRTSDWDYAVKKAVFCKGNMATHPEIVDTAIGVLLDNVDECAVPPEVLLPTERYFSVGVWGRTQDGLRIVSKWLVFRIEDGCYVDSVESVEPTPSIYEQIIDKLDSRALKEHGHDDRYYSKEDIDNKIEDIYIGADVPTKISQLENDKEYVTKDELDSNLSDLEESKLGKSDLDQVIDNALAQAKTSGEFDGYTPVRGTDYWTEEDIAEIKGYVNEAILGGAW